MTEDDADRMDRNRRHFLTVAAAVTGAVGAGFVAVPFLSSLKPSARAQALGAPVEVPLQLSGGAVGGAVTDQEGKAFFIE